jgi:hypothetical protein
MTFVLRSAVTILFFFAGPAPAAEQPKPPAGNAQTKPGQIAMSAIVLTAMIKGTVLALHQANMTGNYSVLRDLGTPIFRERFDQATLTNAFANLRSRKIDLTPALFLPPNLTKNPEINQNGELVLTGDFMTQPLRIHFELLFLQLDGVWRIAGLGVDAIPVTQSQAAAATAQQTPPAQTAKQPATQPAKRPAKASN